MKRPSYKKAVKQGEIDFYSLSLALIPEINLLRSSPEKYVEYLEKDKTFFKGNVLYRPNQGPIRIMEGESIYDDAIEFLKNQEPMEELKTDRRLCLACQEHSQDVGTKGILSNDGSKKESISQRLEKHLEWDYILCQLMDYGSKSAIEIVISLLICDGDPLRSNRKSIFRTDINYVGAWSSEHKDCESVTTIVLVGNIRNLNSLAPEIRDFIPNHIAKVEEERNNPKPRRFKTKFQLEDPNAPDNAVSYSTFKKIKLVDDRAKHCTQRVYTLSDGTQHIVEVFNNLKVRAKTEPKRSM